MGHQIKGGPSLLLTASVQVCNWTEQRADTLTLKERTPSDCPDIHRFVIVTHIKTEANNFFQLMIWHIEVSSSNIC